MLLYCIREVRVSAVAGEIRLQSRYGVLVWLRSNVAGILVLLVVLLLVDLPDVAGISEVLISCN